MRLIAAASMVLLSLSPALAQDDLAKADALLEAGLEDDAIRLLVELAYDEDDSLETAGALYRLAAIKVKQGKRDEGVKMLRQIVARFDREGAAEARSKLAELGEALETPAVRLVPGAQPEQEVCPIRLRIAVDRLTPPLSVQASNITCNGARISRLQLGAKRSARKLSVDARVAVFLPEGEDRNISHGIKLLDGEDVIAFEASGSRPYQGDEGEDNNLGKISLTLKGEALGRCGEACDLEIYVKTAKRKFWGH